MRCPNCGAEAKPGASICEYCASELPQTQVRKRVPAPTPALVVDVPCPPPVQQRPRKTPWWLVVGLVAFGIGCLAILIAVTTHIQNRDAEQIETYLAAADYARADELLDNYMDSSPSVRFCLLKTDSLVGQERYWEVVTLLEDQAKQKSGDSADQLNAKLKEIRSQYAQQLDEQKPVYERKLRMEKNAKQADIPLKSVEALYETLEAGGISTDSLNLIKRYASDTEVGQSCRLITDFQSYDVFFRSDGTVDRIVKGETVYYENGQFTQLMGE